LVPGRGEQRYDPRRERCDHTELLVIPPRIRDSQPERRQAGRFADDPFGDVFLVIDGWSTLRGSFENLEAAVTDLAARGLGFGIHVIAACTRWMELRPAVRDVLGTKLELRLGEPADSIVNRRAAVNVPANTPGRGQPRPAPDRADMTGPTPRHDHGRVGCRLVPAAAVTAATVPRPRRRPRRHHADEAPHRSARAVRMDLSRDTDIGIPASTRYEMPGRAPPPAPSLQVAGGMNRGSSPWLLRRRASTPDRDVTPGSAQRGSGGGRGSAIFRAVIPVPDVALR
jgi:hypothetical protein